MSVAKLSARTAISVRFIEYIEAGEFGRIPGRTYVLGFTRSICRELDLDPEELLQVIKSEMYEGIGASLEKDHPRESGQPRRKSRAFHKIHFLTRCGPVSPRLTRRQRWQILLSNLI